MPSLSKDLRNQLSRTVLEARSLAEEAARKALHALGVDEPDAPAHLATDGRLLRRQLRAQAKQLGDTEDPQQKGRYSVKHLSEKIAYDHWHRLLFARFLSENDLLISPDHGVGVSLADCEELAPALGLRDGWEVAARFAARMLPQIFRADDPAGSVLFAPEDRMALRKLVTGQSREGFLADDALGWVYQFWQAQRKEEVNRSGVKIGADEISPVTQLFTEDYMVDFLLDNTLGAWWTGKHLSKLGGLQSEEECRQALALPGVNWQYLRFIRETPEDQSSDLRPPTSVSWRPAAGTFGGWPETVAKLTCLDPCCGSGHFLVGLFKRLAAMRIAEETLDTRAAAVAVLRDNLFGLEIDPRCTQIAAFNLALAAWKFAGHCALPPLNIACCGLGINARKEDWLRLAERAASASPLAPDRDLLGTSEETLLSVKLKSGMEQMFDLFQKAPDLGSLINPNTLGGDLITAGFHELQPLLQQALQSEEIKADDTLNEMGVTARGLAQAAEILAGHFNLVATNVPYLGSGKQDDVLKVYCEKHHAAAKADLATSFVERCLNFCAKGSSTALVTPQNWLFLGTYKKLRCNLLKAVQWNTVVRLGPKGFQTPMWDFNIALLTLTRDEATVTQTFAGLDIADEKTLESKASTLLSNNMTTVHQMTQMENPDWRITFEDPSDVALLDKRAKCLAGILNGDSPKFQKLFWEFDTLPFTWVFQQSTVERTMPYGGRSLVIYYDNAEGHLREDATIRRVRLHDSDQRGNSAWGKWGVAVSQMSSLPVTLYSGEKCDSNAAVICPNDQTHVGAVWAFAESREFNAAVRRIDQKVNITNATLAKVPFDLDYWQKVAVAKYPNGLPTPHSDDPTQWLFTGHPAGSDNPLQVAIARLLGYRWPRQTGSSFMDCPALEPDGLESLADADGIVCINAIKGEQPAAERLRVLFAAAYSKVWSADMQAHLLASLDSKPATLEEWLRNGFFEEHCKLFHHRPFIWHIWDGLRDGFSVLVNYHKLDRRTFEKLIYTYLGDWIARQKAAVDAGEEGSDAKLAAAQSLKASLEKILEGEAPYDIFVRWKPLVQQPIGWEPDLNDGVRLNIRPFLSVPDVAKKGAGVLRWKPNIKWEKDRGTEPQRPKDEYPWFWGWDCTTQDFKGGPSFDGNRWNDCHYSLDTKRKARL